MNIIVITKYHKDIKCINPPIVINSPNSGAGSLYGSFPLVSQFQIGDEIYINPEAGWYAYESENYRRLGGRYEKDGKIVHMKRPIAIEVQCKSMSNAWPETKLLFFGMLGGLAISKKENGESQLISSKNDIFHEVFDKARECKGNIKDLWEIFKGKCLKVVDTIEARVNFYSCHDKWYCDARDYEIIAVPIFEFVKDNERSLIFRNDYNPSYCYDNFKIYYDDQLKGYGICDHLGRNLFSPIFEAILWGDNKETEMGPGITQGETHNVEKGEKIEFIRFFKNHKKAILRIEELYKMEELISTTGIPTSKIGLERKIGTSILKMVTRSIEL